MTVKELKRIIKDLDDDTKVSVQVTTEDYNVFNCEISGHNTYDNDLVLEVEE